MDSQDSSSSVSPSRDCSSADEDGTLSVTAGPSKDSAFSFQSERFTECVNVLNQLLQKKQDDPKLLIDSMSGHQSSGSQQSGTQPSGVRKQMQFNDEGQPIGEGSSQFSTFVGRIARTHCPPTYVSWRSVPDALKELIWSTLLDEYDIPIIYKGSVLLKANLAWKQWKHELRLHYDGFQTDAERKQNLPDRLRRQDWESFVDLCSTVDDQARREKGKSSRQKMKSPHTSGRRGAARTAEELKKKSPSGTITRTQLYVATHTKKDGTCPFPTMSQQIDEIREIINKDPFLGQKDLDNDPVALVCGRDGRGRVRGMGSGVSKTAFNASAPFKKAAQREKRARESLESRVTTMMQRLDDESMSRRSFEEKLMALLGQFSTHGAHMQDSSEFCSTSQVRHLPVLPESPVNSTSTCLLKNFKMKIVALGRINRDATSSADSYRVIVDEVYDINAELYEGEGTLANITLGDTVTWPKPFTKVL